MKNKIEQCQVCNKTLNKDDEVVVCPICGAPHHKDCYSSLGHCGLEESHGTENQYDLLIKKQQAESEAAKQVKKQSCPQCNRLIEEDAAFCPYCGTSMNEFSDAPGTPQMFKNIKVVMPDLFGGVSKDAQLEGVSVKEVQKFVGPNSQYYIPRFMRMFKSKISWNWAGFLFPYVWCFYRKMYKEGFLCLLSVIAGYIASTPLNKFIYSITATLPSNYTRTQLVSAIIEYIPLINPSTQLLAFIGAVIAITVRLVIGLRGNYLYKNHCIDNIKKIEQNDQDKAVMFAKKGGANPLLMSLFFMLSIYLQDIITLLF